MCLCLELVFSFSIMHAVVTTLSFTALGLCLFVDMPCALKTRQVSVTYHIELPVNQLLTNCQRPQVKALLLIPEPWIGGTAPVGFPNDTLAASQAPQRLLLEVDCYQTHIFTSLFPIITLRVTL